MGANTFRKIIEQTDLIYDDVDLNIFLTNHYLNILSYVENKKNFLNYIEDNENIEELCTDKDGFDNPFIIGEK